MIMHSVVSQATTFVQEGCGLAQVRCLCILLTNSGPQVPSPRVPSPQVPSPQVPPLGSHPSGPTPQVPSPGSQPSGPTPRVPPLRSHPSGLSPRVPPLGSHPLGPHPSGPWDQCSQSPKRPQGDVQGSKVCNATCCILIALSYLKSRHDFSESSQPLLFAHKHIRISSPTVGKHQTWLTGFSCFLPLL